MNRQNKVNWRTARRERFAFSSLEPRLLLAGDVTAGADYSQEFIGPVLVQTPEISCVVEEAETQTLSKDVGKEVEHPTAECSPTIMELDAAFTDTVSFSNLVRGNSATHALEVSTSNFHDTNTRVFTHGPGDEVQYEFNYSKIYRQGETGNSFDLRARESPKSTVAETLSIVAEKKSLNSTSIIESVKPSAEGKYFQNLTSTSLSSPTTELGELGQESFNSVGVIAQRQMFAVVSANAIGNVEVVDTYDAKTQLSTRSMTSNSLASIRYQAASSLDLVDSRNLMSSRDAASNSSCTLNAQGGELREKFASELTSVREMIRSESLQAKQLNQPRIASSAVYRSPFTSMLFRQIAEPFGNVDADSEVVAVVSVERTEHTEDGDMKLARSIQILESAIILIGLPSSRLCREEECSVSKKSV